MTFALVNLICWGAFGIVWILGAIYNYFKAPTVKQKRSDWYIFVLAWFILHLHFLPSRYFAFTKFHIYWVQIVGTVFLILSTVFTLWSRWVLGKMWASIAMVKTDHHLVTEGPYQITRNPIYTGVLGMVLGSSISLGDGTIFLGFIVLLVTFLNRIRLEEQLMTQTFSDQYLEYKNHVPRLIPGLRIFERSNKEPL